jgi:ATP-dependent helicase/nuclease subunit A
MNIVYNASAGTGKTYQVTGLYEKLVLEEGIDPREILLMTFTDNAAAELRMRVAHRLMKARRDAEAANDFESAEIAILAMQRLPSAPIGTIHAYCTRLLREHALEAGLSPGFSVLVGDEYDDLLSRICRTELLKQLETDLDFKAFCSGAHIIGDGGGFGTSVTETVPKLIGEAGSLGISLEAAEAMLPAPEPPVSIVDFIQILHELNALTKKTKKIQEAITALDAALSQTEAPAQVVELFDQNFSGHFSYGEARSIYPKFKELKEETASRELYRQRHPQAQAFARYVQTVARKFQQQKHEMDAVDFDDLLHMATSLLTSGKAKPLFKYIIVDEVQDTSRIQCDLIQSLWKNEGHLVICGDKKQSIYTWRGADPQVMPDLEKAILGTENSKLENLQTSYRSKGPVIDVVNALFSSVYDPADYADGDNLKPNPDFATEGEKPCVEFLSFDGDEETAKPDKVAAEMEAVANRIQLLVNGDSTWKPSYRYKDGFDPTSDTNTYRYSDILILLRRTSHQSVLEQALRHASVPYTLGGKGRGLFTRQETRDVSLFLNVITNPDDAYSLIGFLRSPWVGLSDETIAELAWSDDGFSIENLKKRYSEKTDIIDRYRNLLNTKLASELVRMLVQETAYDALLAGLPRGEQRLANLRKVLDWLRQAEHGARVTPTSVARKMADNISNPPQIPEAALLDPAQNAVTIMTVHGSKGLTKRVVFLPDTSFQPDSDRSFAKIFYTIEAQRHREENSVPPCLCDEKLPSLGVKITAPDKSAVASPGFKKANEHAKAVREHELKNLFYVAMTRARDLVVTSATVGRKPQGWLAQMESLIGNQIPSIPYSALAAEADLHSTSNIPLPTVIQLAESLTMLPPPPAPPSLRRVPVTRLTKEEDRVEAQGAYEQDEFKGMKQSAALGSLGHAVLEQLALNNWQGSVAEWLERMRDEFRISKNEALSMEDQIEKTRELMIQLTGNMKALHPEFSFLLHKGDNRIDGSIDLLCETRDGFAVFDYKFTKADDRKVIEQYQSQMDLYKEAAGRKFPNAGSESTTLIVITKDQVRTVDCPQKT